MQHPVNVPGFEGRNLVVETSPWSTPKLLVDGSPAPAGPKRNQYAIKPDNSNHEVLMELKTRFPDSIPVVYANGNEYRIAEPLGKFALIWSVVPLVLMLVGGAIGGLLGGVAAAANLQAMRSDLPIPARYAISGIFSFAAFIIWLTIALSLQGELNPSSTQATVPQNVTAPAPGFASSAGAISSQ